MNFIKEEAVIKMIKRWYIHFPGAVYANGPIDADNEIELIKKVKKLFGIKRLPKKFSYWETSD